MNDSRKFLVGLVASVLLIIVDLWLLMSTDIPMSLFWVILIVSIVILVLPIVSFEGTKVEMTGDRLRVKAAFVDLAIPLSSIPAVEYRETFDVGLRMFGYGGLRKGSGDFTNKEFGAYVFAGDTRIHGFVVVKYSGKIAAFNTMDETTTRGIYDAIVSATGSEGGTVMSSKDPETLRRSHRNLKWIMVSCIAVGIVVVIVVVALALFSGHADASMDEDSLTIDATMMHQDIAYTDIAYVELREDMDYGMRIGGYGGADISSGKFRNDEFGNYKLAVHNSVDACIVVHRTNGEVTVFNLQDDGSTREFYDRLSTAVSEAKGSVSAPHWSVAIA